MKYFSEFILERSKNDPMPEVYKDKKLAYFIIGSPASGKNFFVDNEILRKNRNFKQIDPDQKSDLLTNHLNKIKKSFKDRLTYIEYLNILNGRIEKYPMITGLTKEIEKQFEILLHEETNIIYNSTGNNRDLLSYLINKCNEFGYEIVFLHVMGKNLDWQINKSDFRAALTGRPVDKEYLKNIYKNSHKMAKYYSNLNINNYYLIWNRGEDDKPMWYRYDNGKLLKKSGSVYKPVRESLNINNNNGKRVLHAFDMDDTLIYAPKLSDFLKDGIPIKTEIGRIIINELSKNGLSIDDTTIENNRVTVESFKAPDDWEINSNGRSIMPKPSEFYGSVESLGDKTNPKIEKVFDSVENKCIITGRAERIRSLIEDHLYDLDIYPNKGIYMCPDTITKSYDVGIWKSNVIKNLLEVYDEIHFYEDKKSWVSIVRGEIQTPKLTIYLVENGEVIKKI